MRRYIYLIGMMVFLLGGLSACANLLAPRPDTPMERYTLQMPAVVPAQKHTHKTLFVAQPTASPGYQTTHMVYFEKPYQLSVYQKSEWIAPPAQMLLPLLVNALSQQQYFAAVVSPPVSSLTDYTLNTNVVSCAQDFIASPTLRFTLQVTLVDNRKHQVHATQFMSAQVSTDRSPEGAVRSANLAVEQVLLQLNEKIVTWLPTGELT